MKIKDPLLSLVKSRAEIREMVIDGRVAYFSRNTNKSSVSIQGPKKPLILRAWDTRKQHMTGLPFAIAFQTNAWMLVKDYARGGWMQESTSRFIPLEYTGHEDQDDVRIFQDDILEIEDDSKVWHSLVFWDDGWCIEWEAGIVSLSRFANKSKVIGNLYANPELLSNNKN